MTQKSSTIVSSTAKLQLSGSATPSSGVTYQWAETSGLLNLANRDNLLTSLSSPNLVVKPNVLVPGNTYTFALSATNSDGTGRASIGILL